MNVLLLGVFLEFVGSFAETMHNDLSSVTIVLERGQSEAYMQFHGW